jgi:flagellar motor switch/type III secretory pathway protein FliN
VKTKIAVATVNGRAYYELVNELQRKRLPFFSIKPWDPVPLDVKVVLTTKEEQGQISHPKTLSLKTESHPESVIDEAILIIQGKQNYQKIVVGVDPGKSCGIALLGDDKVLETLTASSVETATNLVVDNLKRFQAETRLVRVGDGMPEYTKTLLVLLDSQLPEDVMIQIVVEVGTSRLTNKSVNRRVIRDTISAIRIAGRNGRVFSRRNFSED